MDESAAAGVSDGLKQSAERRAERVLRAVQGAARARALRGCAARAYGVSCVTSL